MKKFLISLFCITMFVACGEDEGGKSDPPDCTPVDCTPVNCTKPDDAQVIEPDAATGTYDVFATMDLDTCNDPSQASEDEFELGEWVVAMTSDGYLFFSMYYGMLLSSSDGTTFTLVDEPFSSCDSLSVTWTAELTFDDYGLEGSLNQHIVGEQCAEYDENWEVTYVDYDCEYEYGLMGLRQ